ncbi:uncharacterized protein LOC110908166 [Helianthus annuus]|uniref:uncharacterized protein LOC110908166 n=1 Tax=Helianthus annuus TaxID=4232 RepID=UPI000B8FD5D1|nr:uncharacterized protein LOC110908166 [Helianthus annuus]XP_022008758.1 uncharacterized protein LOC110908166 [Helianthus annuus]
MENELMSPPMLVKILFKNMNKKVREKKQLANMQVLSWRKAQFGRYGVRNKSEMNHQVCEKTIPRQAKYQRTGNYNTSGKGRCVYETAKKLAHMGIGATVPRRHQIYIHPPCRPYCSKVAGMNRIGFF